MNTDGCHLATIIHIYLYTTYRIILITSEKKEEVKYRILNLRIYLSIKYDDGGIDASFKFYRQKEQSVLKVRGDETHK